MSVSHSLLASFSPLGQRGKFGTVISVLWWYCHQPCFLRYMRCDDTVINRVSSGTWGVMTSAHQPCFLRYMRCNDLCSSTVFPPVYEVRWPLLINRVSSGIWGVDDLCSSKVSIWNQPCFLRYMRCGWPLFIIKVSIRNQPFFFLLVQLVFLQKFTIFVWQFTYYDGLPLWLTSFRVPLEINLLLIFEIFSAFSLTFFRLSYHKINKIDGGNLSTYLVDVCIF